MTFLKRSHLVRNAAQKFQDSGDVAAPFLTPHESQSDLKDILRQCYEGFQNSGLEYKQDTFLGHLLDKQAAAWYSGFNVFDAKKFLHLCNGGKIRTVTGCLYGPYANYIDAYAIPVGYDQVSHYID